MFIKRKRRLSPSAKWLLGIVALALLACVINCLLGVSATYKWERYTEEIRASGMPLTYPEVLRHQSQPPDGPTAADVITERCETLRHLKKSDRTRRLLFFDYRLFTVDLTVGIPEYAIEPTRALLDEHRALLDELLAVADLPAGALPAQPTYHPRPAERRWEAVAARHAVMLLQNQAVISILDEDSAAALKAVRSQLRILATLDESPGRDGHYEQKSCSFRTLPSIEGMLHATKLDDQTVESLSSEVQGRLRASTLRSVLLGTRAWWVATCEQLLSGELKLSTFHHAPAPHWEWTPVWLIRRGQMRGAELFTRFLDMDDDLPLMLSAAQQVDREVLPISIADWPFLAMGSMGIADECRMQAWSVAKLRSTHAALAAERYRMETGRFPVSIDELVPKYLDAVPVDPFDGKPMRLATTEQGIVIYSVFDNLIDDGGDVAKLEKRVRTPDIGFRLTRPEHRGIVLLDDPMPEPFKPLRTRRKKD